MPKPDEQQMAAERITVPGPKMREVASVTPPQPDSRLAPDRSRVGQILRARLPITTGSTPALGFSR